MKSNLYAKYYFELRGLYKNNKKEFPNKPISKIEAQKLEIRTNKFRDIFEGVGKKAKRKVNLSIGSLKPKNIWGF